MPFNDPYYSDDLRALQNAFIRFLHASPNAPAVDIYINDVLRVRGLVYQGFSTYISLPAGTYNVRIYPTGQSQTPVINTNLNLAATNILTAAVIGRLPNVSVLAIPEPKVNVLPSNAYLRFISLSPNAPNLDLTLPTGQKLFRDIAYKAWSAYIPINPGRYTFQVRESLTNRIVLSAPNIRLKPNKVYSIYAVGFLGETPAMQILVPLDGSTYIKTNRE